MRVVFVAIISILLFLAWIYSVYSTPTHRMLPVRHHNICPVTFRKDALKPCSSNDDCSTCENGMFTCTTIDSENSYTYSRGGETLSVPKGSWCLPPKVEDIDCNNLTGDRVLTHDPSLGKFIWRCQCKHPLLVRNRGVYGDCTQVAACNDGDLVCPPSATTCTPGEKWEDDPTWDPSIGICSCPKGKRYITSQDRKLCVHDTCYPGTTDEDGMCRCPDPIQDSSGKWSSTVPNNVQKTCIPDPCNPEGYTSGGRCVCNRTSVPYQDELSPTGWICKTPCDDTNPCGSRGTCTFDSTGNVRCTNCRYPNYQSADGLCNNIVKHGNVECNRNEECETRACDKTLAPIWAMGNGKKYCSPW